MAWRAFADGWDVVDDDVDDLWDLVELRDEMEAADDDEYRGPPDVIVDDDDARTADAILGIIYWVCGTNATPM